MTGPKVLLGDIESSPHLAYSFQLWNTTIYPKQIVIPGRTICWSAKWLDGKKVLFDSEYHSDYLTMLNGIRDLLDEADVAVGYNSNRFDWPRLRQQFRLNNIAQPSPFVQVDMYRVIKNIEDWPSHKLAYITEALDLSGKLDTDFSLWRECLGDFGEERQRKGWLRMRRYSKRDTVTLEELFRRYEADITTMPALSLFTEADASGVLSCPVVTCGSLHVQRRGYAYTKTRKYARFQCQSCGKWFRHTRSEKGATVT